MHAKPKADRSQIGDGKVRSSLVTGATSGIGEATARKFVAADNRVLEALFGAAVDRFGQPVDTPGLSITSAEPGQANISGAKSRAAN